MATSFQQTNTAHVACANDSYCSGNTKGASTLDKEASEGGSTGGGGVAFSVDPSANNYDIVWIFIVDGTNNLEDLDGATGNWTFRLNCTQAKSTITWTGVAACRINSSCTNQETILDDQTLSQSFGTTGVKTAVVNQSSLITMAAGDTVAVLHAFDNSDTMMFISSKIAFDQNIDNQWSAGGGPTPQAVVATATGVAVVGKLPKKVISVTATGTPVVSRGLTLYRTLAVTATGVASVTRKMYETVSATAVGLAVVTKSKQFARVITATAVGVVAVSKLPKKVIAVIATGSAIVNRRLTLSRAISATAVGSALVVRKMYETVAATATGIPLITRQLQFTKVITATAVGVVTQTKLVKKMVAVTALATPLVVRKMFVAVAATAIGVAVVDVVAKFFQVVASTAVGVAVVATNYIPFVPGGVSAGRFIKWMGGFLGR